FEQLRALPVSREADPLDDRQRPRGPPPARLRRWTPGPRLDPRRRSLSRAACGAGSRQGRRGLQLRLRQRVAQCGDRPAAAGAARPRPRADRARRGPARPRPALRHRRLQGAARAGMGAAGLLRPGPGADGPLVSGKSRLVGARAVGRVSLLVRAQLRSAMTILVTGAGGLVGSRVVARLAAAGEKAVGIGRAQVDLRDAGRLRALLDDLRPDGIIHCGAMTDVDGCEKDPEGAWAVNAAAVEVLARSRARLTAISTDYVFDGETGDYSEDDIPNPRGVYARSKRAGEEAALRASDRAVCRVAVIYSGYQSTKHTFASSAAANLLEGQPVKAFADQIV